MRPKITFTRDEAVPPNSTYDASSLRGKSVIITGAASGIGEASMRAFVAVGALVTFGDIAEDRGAALVAELGHDKVAFVHCDILSWHDQLKLFKTALERWSRLDIVIANAGIASVDEVCNHTEDDNGDPVEPGLATLRTNIIGTMYTAKLARYYFAKQPEDEDRDRCLLMTASLAGYLDQGGLPQYNSSKWAVRGLMHSLRVTEPQKHIRVNLIAPWFIKTAIVSQEVADKITANGIELAVVEDAAAAFVHLAADKFINGRALAIVPRSRQECGYYDLQRDDWNAEDPLTEVHKLVTGVYHRAAANEKK